MEKYPLNYGKLSTGDISSMIVLTEMTEFVGGHFRSPECALYDALKTPGIIESSDSIASPDYLETNSRAKNGFSLDDYNLPQFRIRGE